MQQVLLFVTYIAKPGKRETFLEEIRAAGLGETIAREAGCLRYEYVYPPGDADTILLIEQWQTQAHQQRHLSQPHMERLRAVKDRHIAATRVETFLVSPL